MFKTIIEALSLPILLVNTFGGIVAGIWLAFLGKWKLLLIGIVLLFTAHFYLSILMLPGLLLSSLSLHLYQKKNPLRHVAGFVSIFYTNLLIVGTCAFAFYICTRFYDGLTKFGLTPYLLWSWGMALGPWQFFHSKERDNEFSTITLLSASVFYFLFLTSVFLGPIFVVTAAALFLIVQLICLPVFDVYVMGKLQEHEF